MRARRLLAAAAVVATAVVVAVAVAMLAGCSKKLRPVDNLPPAVYVFVRGPVDTVNHRVHLYWYGTDPDGEVEAYAVRWVYPPPASQNPPWDTLVTVSTADIDCEALRSWKNVLNPNPPPDSLEILRLPQRIHIADSVFTMFTGDSAVVTPRFEIFAIDNECSCSETAKQTFLLGNQAPTVQITNPLRRADSTYASVTVSWAVTDPDGGGPGLYYRIWLDGNEAQYDSTSEQTFTVPSARFLQNGTYRSGPRILYVQAVDDGGRVGPPTSTTWYVRAPAAILENNQGRLLVVDDVPSPTPGCKCGSNNDLFDAFYKSVADLLPAGTYSVLRPQFNSSIFRSGQDLAQTFRQFKAVLWYRGDEVTVAPWLKAYQDSLGAYVDGGGNFYVDGVYLVQGLRTPGAFREDFVERYLGSSRLIYCEAGVGGGVRDSTAGWSSNTGGSFRSSLHGAEVFRALTGPSKVDNDSTGGVRVFAVNDTNNVALWALAGQLDPPNVGFEAPVGVTVPNGTGRLVVLTLPVRYAPPAQAKRMLQRMLSDFGIGMPLP